MDKVAYLWNDEVEQYSLIPKQSLNCMPWAENSNINDDSPWLVLDDDVYLNMMKKLKQK